MSFAEPLFLLGFLLLLPMIWIYRNPKRRASIPFSSTRVLNLAGVSRLAWLRHSAFALRLSALSFMILALARPQMTDGGGKRTAEGLDIMLVVDTSGSMRAQDFVINGQRPTRLEVIKSVIAEFITNRTDDRIGMVVFGTEAFTQAPLTLDQNVLLAFLSQVRVSMAGDATAIGDGLATAVRRLKDVSSKSRIVILLTDGANTAGRIDPVAAAQAAEALGIKVYTIGVGSKGSVPIEVNGRTHTIEVDIDEPLMKKMATMTGGQYFRAVDTEALQNVYKTIDRLEKSKSDARQHRKYDERFAAFLWPALALILAELGFGLTRFRRIP